jgi:hypothetical protein
MLTPHNFLLCLTYLLFQCSAILSILLFDNNCAKLPESNVTQKILLTIIRNNTTPFIIKYFFLYAVFIWQGNIFLPCKKYNLNSFSFPFFKILKLGFTFHTFLPWLIEFYPRKRKAKFRTILTIIELNFMY